MIPAHNNSSITIMKSNNCRTGLTSIAFILMFIVSGCSGLNTLDKTHEAPPSSNSTEVKSERTAQPVEEREPIETDSSASDDASAMATPEKKYSGGSKAPSGEYRPADEHGPAQNVPVPKIPEGMDVESAEGLLKFVEYWNSARNYAVETGNTTLVRERTSAEYSKGIKNFDAWDKLRLIDGWTVGGLQKVKIDPSLIQSLGNGFYEVPMNSQTDDAITIKDGMYLPHALSQQDKNTYILKLQYADDKKWYLINIEEFKS